MYKDNDKYEFNTRSVGPFNNNKLVIYGINESNVQRQEIDKDMHKNIFIIYKYKDFIGPNPWFYIDVCILVCLWLGVRGQFNRRTLLFHYGQAFLP